MANQYTKKKAAAKTAAKNAPAKAASASPSASGGKSNFLTRIRQNFWPVVGSMLLLAILILVGLFLINGLIAVGRGIPAVFAAPAAPKAAAPVALAPAANPAAVEAPAAIAPDPVASMPLLNCETFGSYKPVKIGETYEYWMEHDHKVSGSKELSDLKVEGGSCSFSVPSGYTAIWNQSAGKVTVDGKPGLLGNPVIFDGKDKLTGKIVANWETGNDSAGVMLTLVPK